MDHKAKKAPLRRRMLVADISEDLREQIERGDLKPGQPILSAKLLAEKYNSTPLTINRALSILVEQKLVYRQQGSGTFVHKEALDALRKSTRRIAIDVGLAGTENVVESMSFNAAEVIADHLQGLGHETFFISSRDFQDRERLEGECDGLLVSRWLVNEQNLNTTFDYSKPIVMFRHDEIHDMPFHQVVPDWVSGMLEAIRHLYATGIRKITIASSESAAHRYRRALWQELVRSSRPDIEIIAIEAEPLAIGDAGRIAGKVLGQRLQGLSASDHAVFSTMDMLSFGIIDAMKEESLVEGRDYRLLSCGDIEGEGIAPFGDPMLTTISRGHADLALRAADLLLDIIADDPSETRIVRTPTKLVRRETLP